MKNLNSLMLAAAGCLALASCSGDDDSTNNNVSSDLTGTYELTSQVAGSAQDYDGDGNSSTNLVTEGSCQAETWIQFMSDGTYRESSSQSVASNGGADINCETKISTGTYVQDGDEVTTTRTSGSGELTATFTFNADAHTLTRSDSDGRYSSFNTASQIWANVTGNLNLTFTKVSDGTSESDIENGSDSNIGLLGNFGLTSFLVGNGQDLDNDGEESFDLTNETNCYTESNITFNSDGTYDEEFTKSILTSTGLALECNTETRTGTYTRDGDEVTLTRATGSGNVNTVFDFNSATNTLSRRDNNGNYPSLNLLTSLFAMISGTVDLEYDKSRN